MMSLFREQKLLATLLIFSVVVLGVGLFMIQSINKTPEQHSGVLFEPLYPIQVLLAQWVNLIR